MADRVVDFLFGVVSGGFDLFCPSLSRIRFRGVCERYFSVFYLGVGVGDTLVRRLSDFAERFVAVMSCPGRYVVLYLGGAYMLKLEMLQEMLSMLKSRVKRGGEA